MATVHLLTQYVWPDGAPTGLYAEQLAQRLRQLGSDVRLVGGQGNYRTLEREKPPVPILHLEHFEGRRGNLLGTLREYVSVKRAFAHYIDNFVRRDDIVIVTSAPPNTVQLAARVKRRGARAIYWLQDYYPELVRGVREYPAICRHLFRAHWDNHLLHWDTVVKIGANLAGPSANSVVIRNWPTFEFGNVPAPEPKTALYSGNFGYGHDVKAFVSGCERLRDQGYKINIRADGRGVKQLPTWLDPKPLHHDFQLLRKDLIRHQVHLVAAHPDIQRAVFPSKIWNSIALGRELVCTGFAGQMLTELNAARECKFDQHLDQWAKLILGTDSIAEISPSPGMVRRAAPALTPAVA